MLISIIIPVLNEASTLSQHLHRLRKNIITAVAASGDTIDVEIIVVDGGSTDDTVSLAALDADKVLESPKGRAHQMNAGAEIASGDVLLFLHIDTRLPDTALTDCAKLVSSPSRQWGFFTVALSGQHYLFRLIETMMNLRSRLTYIATGDQCLCISRNLFQELQGYAVIPLMEDVEICKRLRKQAPPKIMMGPVTTSSRRWEQKGILRTVWLMWKLRALYFFGVSPARLVADYYPQS